MPLPTPEEFLARLAASPTDAAAFDEATHRERPHCKTRREAVVATLSAVKATLADNAAMKAKLAASKNKLVALETARATAARLKTSPQTPMTTPSATSIASEILRLQAEAVVASKLKTRAEFDELTPRARNEFIRNGGKLI